MSKIKLLFVSFLIVFLCFPSTSGTAGNIIQSGPPDWEMEGDQSSARFGWSVSTAGDVNCDGFDDVIVGAKFYDVGAYLDAGKAYVYYGSETGLSSTPAWEATSPTLEYYGYFGAVVASAGDVNGDGCGDVMVSNYNYGGADTGAVFVWYGSSTGLSAIPNWNAQHTATFAHFGWSMGGAGDVNGDGYDDIIAGAYRYDSAGTSNAYVWYGSETGLGANGTPSNADWVASSDQALSAFGTSVGSAGDVNGDGYDDVFVGAQRYSNGETKEGMVFVWHGSITGLVANGTPTNADWKAESNQADARFGGDFANGPDKGSAGTAGDINGDGYDEFMIGSLLYDNPEINEGAVFMWYGSGSGLNGGVDGDPSNAGWMIESNQDGAWLGTAVGTPGDINDDGYDDVMMSAGFYNYEGVTDSGLVVLWFGSEEGLHNSATVGDYDWMNVPPSCTDCLFGWSLSSAGDVNGDHVDDLMIGAQNSGNSYAGLAAVWHGVPRDRIYLPMIVR